MPTADIAGTTLLQGIRAHRISIPVLLDVIDGWLPFRTPTASVISSLAVLTKFTQQQEKIPM
jgi:hypothetical protein